MKTEVGTFGWSTWLVVLLVVLLVLVAGLLVLAE
jgi:hypothetical protein